MRKHIPETSELKEQLKAELARFKELDALKKVMWETLAGDNAASLQEWETLKALWQDSAEEITHIHRKLYPYFPRGYACPNCGADTMPVLGSNKHDMYACIACGKETLR